MTRVSNKQIISLKRNMLLFITIRFTYVLTNRSGFKFTPTCRPAHLVAARELCRLLYRSRLLAGGAPVPFRRRCTVDSVARPGTRRQSSSRGRGAPPSECPPPRPSRAVGADARAAGADVGGPPAPRTGRGKPGRHALARGREDVGSRLLEDQREACGLVFHFAAPHGAALGFEV